MTKGQKELNKSKKNLFKYLDDNGGIPANVDYIYLAAKFDIKPKRYRGKDKKKIIKHSESHVSKLIQEWYKYRIDTEKLGFEFDIDINSESAEEFEVKTKFEVDDNEAVWEYNSKGQIETLEQALEIAKVDLSVWTFDKWIKNSWGMTTAEGVGYTNHQVKVWFYKKIGLTAEKQESIIKEARNVQILVPKNKGFQTWLLMCCVHRPFHDQKLWAACMSLIKDLGNKLDGIVLMGDYLDLKTLSSHEKNQPLFGLTLEDEYSDGLTGITEIEAALGKRKGTVKKKFIFGNHEDRYFRHVKDIGASKYGRALQDPVAGLRLEEMKWDYFTNWKEDYVTLGDKLDVFHGDFTAVNACKAHLDRISDRNGVFGHTHRWGSYSNGKCAAYNIGWMGDEESHAFKYVSRWVRAKWEKGFAIAHIDNNGNDYVDPIRVYNSGFFFGGKHY